MARSATLAYLLKLDVFIFMQGHEDFGKKLSKKLKKLKKFLGPEDSCEVVWEDVKEPHCAIQYEKVKAVLIQCKKFRATVDLLLFFQIQTDILNADPDPADFDNKLSVPCEEFSREPNIAQQ